MQYEKYQNIAYNVHLINTNKFKTISVKINFKRKLEKKEITYRNLLAETLLEGTKKYPSRRQIDIACEELYNIGCGCETYISGNYHIISFGCNFLNEKYTEEEMNEKSLQFFLDFIFNPNADNKQFNEEIFKNAKNIQKDDIESFKDSPNRYAKMRLLEEMAPNEPLSYYAVGYIEDLNEINSSNLYEYYESILKSDLIDIFIIGDFKNPDMKKIINNNFNINIMKKPSSEHIVHHTKINKKTKTIKEQKNINQSHLIMAYKTEAITPFERLYIAPVYSYILGGGPDSRLFQNVREKNSLCYSISSSFSGVNNLLYISSGINAKDFNKATRIIKNQVRKLNNGDFNEDDINKANATFLSSIKEIDDSPHSLLNIYISKEYLNYDLLPEREKNINKVNKDMILAFSKKIHLDTIFLLEGSKTDE